MAGTENHPSRIGRPAIAAMEPWYFWARIDSVGLDRETVEALETGQPTPDQLDRARELGMAAKNALIQATVQEPYVRRPS